MGIQKITTSKRSGIFGMVLAVTFLVLLTGIRAQSQPAPAEISPIEAPFEMPQLQRPTFPDSSFDIRDFGARMRSEESGFKNTDAIHRAIEAAHQAGGGKVVIPEGEWLTGPVHLMSNINLHIAEGATLYFSTDKEDYLPVVRVRYEGVEAYNYSPLIYAKNLQNVAITGKGTLDAQGDHWWSWFEEHGAPPAELPPRAHFREGILAKGQATKECALIS
ncbi:MAG: hypothetical protein U5K69_17925 [Balneolaceae bacterium]|nr:hypothetical protein [Balneolaceae bacterium]